VNFAIIWENDANDGMMQMMGMMQMIGMMK